MYSSKNAFIKTGIYLPLLMFVFFACENPDPETLAIIKDSSKPATPMAKPVRYEGLVSNGYKGDKISFEISADGRKLQNLVFTGYWKCASGLDQISVGPDGSFVIENHKVNGQISEPPDGGSTAWRFELQAQINGEKASGTFRMNINNLGCDTYKLKWEAVRK